MNCAIERAIYYSREMKDYLQNPNIIFYYNDLDSLKNIADQYINSIDVKSGKFDNICLQIIQSLPYKYNKLLFDKTAAIYIVTRDDQCIQIINNETENDQFAIIKTDSVKCEIPKSSWGNWIFGASLLVLAAGGTYLGYKE